MLTDWRIVYDREKKELKAKQAKQSVDSVKLVITDKAIKNRAERDRCVSRPVKCEPIIE